MGRLRLVAGRLLARLAQWRKDSRRVPESEVSTVLSQLATLMGASVPLVQSLTAIGWQHQGELIGEVLEDVTVSVEKRGFLFSAALSQYPQVFPAFVVLFVRAGEQTGTLDGRLQAAASLLDRHIQLKNRLRHALVGPSVTLLVALTVMVVCAKWVVPRLGEMYTGLNAPLPLVTQFVLLTAALISHPLSWLLAAGLGAAAYRHRKLIQERLFVFAIRTPKLSRWVGTILCSQFCDIVGSLVKEGVTVMAALRMVADNAGMEYHKRHLEGIWKRLRDDGELPEALNSVPYFPRVLGAMAEISLEAGSLERFLEYLSQMMRDEVDIVIESCMAMLEPLLIAGLGMICAVLMVGMFLPLYGILTQL